MTEDDNECGDRIRKEDKKAERHRKEGKAISSGRQHANRGLHRSKGKFGEGEHKAGKAP